MLTSLYIGQNWNYFNVIFTGNFNFKTTVRKYQPPVPKLRNIVSTFLYYAFHQATYLQKYKVYFSSNVRFPVLPCNYCFINASFRGFWVFDRGARMSSSVFCTFAVSTQERGGERAGAFPVVERLRLALRIWAGASLCSCVWAGGGERYRFRGKRVRTAPLPKWDPRCKCSNAVVPAEGLQL